MPRSSKSAAASSSSSYSSAKAKQKATRAQQTFDALHKEMEIAEYATTTSGQRVRRVPRAQAPKRTAKRKALQREDLDEMAITADDDDDDDDDEAYNDEKEQQQLKSGSAKRRSEAAVTRKATKRLRGSMVAFEDVVLKSMPLASSLSTNNKKGRSTRQNNSNNGNNKSDNDYDDNEQLEEVQQTESERYEMLQEVAKLGINVDTTNKDEEDVDDDDDEDYEDSGEEQEDEVMEDKNGNSSSSNNNNSNLSTSKQKTKRGPYKKNTKKNRVLHRMREFSSHRMAQQHGEAIAAHVRGQSYIAVAKLRQVAQAAPTAPQVYSSLGMVYESMLTEVEKEIDNRMISTDPSATTAADLGDESFVELIERQLELARKTYGSYHVASLLCKRDFVLWERSGDAAIRVSHIFDDVIMMYKSGDKNSVSTTSGQTKSNNVDHPEDETDRFDPNAGPEKWRADRKVWYKHAFSAYDAADKLRPPGVDIPCKLAEVQMNLGNYIQALSILTDLRNKANGKSSRSGMEESPSCWLLYADLMLKIGYECKKWNENMVPSYRNTFKRWLRKYSKSFDWKERRLQALCLALEAAAGSASCSELVKWMRKRAQKYIEKNEKEDADIDDTANDDDDDDDDDDGEAGNDARKHADANTNAHDTSSTANEIEVLTYEQKRGELVKQNGLDLDRFDAMTKEMNLSKASRAYRDRVAAREELVERQRNAIKELALLEQHGGPNQKNDDNDCAPDQSDEPGPTKILPIQSSCATVYNICRLLLRQCLHLGLYEGGVLVVQSVLRYLQERASMKEKGNKSQQGSTNQLLGGGLVQSGFGYDQLHHDSDESDDDDSVIFLSDDEELQDPSTLQSFKDGVLPIDVNAMYSVCLLGAGGQDYVALNNLENILRSNQLELFDKEEFPCEESQGDEHNWIAFKKHFASPLGKTSMVAIIAGVVKDRTPGLSSRRILSLLRSHLKVIDHNDGLDDLLSGPNVLLRANLLRILLAAAQLMLRCDALELKKLHEPGMNESETVKNVAADVLQTLTTLTRFQHVMWCPNNLDWSLKGISIETLSIFAESLDVLVQAMAVVKSEDLIDTVEVALMKSRYLMSTIFHAESSAAKPSISFDYKAWRTFPLPIKECQTEFERKLSTKTYNLCVALCVSAFSGWEPEEFRVDKLRSRDDDTHFFGITFSNERVKGFLSQDITSNISQQWQRVQSMLPNLEVLDFESHMDDRRSTDWYQSAMNNIKQQTGKVAIFGEEEGIKSLLLFSTLCLVAATATKKKNDKGDLLKLSMSILLPITQFVIDKQIWDSQIGAETRKEKDEVDYYLGEQMQWMGPTKASKEVRFQPAPKPYLHMQQQQQQQQVLRSSLTQKPPAPRPKISEVVKVPTSVLLEEWNKHGSSAETNAPNAVRDMKKLDDAMKNLRKSRTLNALERSSIDVSAALVDVAANEQCFNPFLCLQQAAMYAEIGSKMGSNDEPFKRCLPSKEICTSLEALVVLGRADCLRAIHFLHEAQYLCSWVISVCRLHRDRQEASFTWDARWRVVGILCYVVKATIDESGEAHYNNNNKSAWSLRAWEDEAQEEANRGKSDALILVGAESSEVSNEVDKAVNSNNGYYDSNMLHASQNGFAAEQLDYNQQLGELPVPNIDDVQIQVDEYDGIQVVGI